MYGNPLPAGRQRSQPGLDTARMALATSHEPTSAMGTISIRTISPGKPRPQHPLSCPCRRDLDPFLSLIHDFSDRLSTAHPPVATRTIIMEYHDRKVNLESPRSSDEFDHTAGLLRDTKMSDRKPNQRTRLQPFLYIIILLQFIALCAFSGYTWKNRDQTQTIWCKLLFAEPPVSQPSLT